MRRTRTTRPAGTLRRRGRRDTGIVLGARTRRLRRARATRILAIVGCLLAVLLGAAVLDRLPRRHTRPWGAANVPSAAAVPAALSPERAPTPLFARYRSLHLRLPVDEHAITQVAFHQASNRKALHIESLVPMGDVKTAARLRQVRLRKGETPEDPGTAIWRGEVLRLWRSNRSGPPDTAVDVGADAGTDVLSPVTGRVVAVREYELYDRYPDMELHIQPDGWDDIDVVLIHVTDISVREGDRVVAGVTRIAAVRRMSDKMDLQLAGYTRNGGDHVHVQLNRIEVPGRLEGVSGS